MKDSTITVRISEQEKKMLMEVAARKDVAFSQLVREAIRQYIAPFEQELSVERFKAYVENHNKEFK